MADTVTVKLANPYGDRGPGDTLDVAPELARSLRRGGIAQPAEAAHADETVEELKEDARKLGVSTGGKKADLVKRVADAESKPSA